METKQNNEAILETENTAGRPDADKPRKHVPPFIILAAIAIIAALALALTNAVTKDPIREAKERELAESFRSVMPAAENLKPEEVALTPEQKKAGVSSMAKIMNGETLLGYCVKASAKGYESGGSVSVLLGFNEKGEVIGAQIGDSDFKETSTLGGKWLAPKYTSSLLNLTAQDGGQLDTISGATMTSKAVVKAANNSAAAASEAFFGDPWTENRITVLAEGETEPADYVLIKSDSTSTAVLSSEYAPRSESRIGSGKGFGNGDVIVTVSVDEAETITAIEIDASSQAPEGDDRKGLQAGDDWFKAQFVGKKLPVAYGDGIEAISGATMTSNAVIEAINSAKPAAVYVAKNEAGETVLNINNRKFVGSATVVYDINRGDITVRELTEEELIQEEIEESLESAPLAAGKYTGSAIGFYEPITVYVTLDADGTIQELTIDASTQSAKGDDPMGLAAGEEAFTSQFIGKTLPVAYGDGIEAITGATMTSNAVIEALNNLTPVEDEKLPAGKYTGTAVGFYEPITVYVMIDTNGTIQELTIDASTQSAKGDDPMGLAAGEEAFTSQFIGKPVPTAYGEGIEAITGATMTSNAVIEALNTLTPVAEASEEALTELASADAGRVAVDEQGTANLTPEEEYEGMITVTYTIENGKIVAAEFVVPAESNLPAAEPENVLTATEEGFYAPVTVYVTLDGNTITSLKIDASKQSPDGDDRKGQKAGDEAFTSQFIGKTLPVAYGDGIEAISGATITSDAVIKALNSLTPAAEEPAAEVLTASEEGFYAPVTVYVTLDGNTITSLKIDASKQSPDGDDRKGQKAGDEAFTSQFIGKTLPVAYGDGIEAISGATMTSEAVIKALNSLTPAAEEPAAEVLTASEEGFYAPVTVYVTLDGNTITSLEIDASKQSPDGDDRKGQKAGDEAFTSQFIGKTLPVAYGDGIEAISGATMTSEAVIKALNSLTPFPAN